MAFFFTFSLYPLIAPILLIASVSWIEATKNGGGITIDLIHRDSPLSPSYNLSKTRFERLQNAFKRSASRKSSLESSINIPSATKHDLEAPVIPGDGEYLMKIGLGTPPVEIVAIADTGSDLTWTQCQPCKYCYKQKAPLFDPKNTSTYITISCESQACSQVDTASCDAKNTCEYQYSYGDGSYTSGDLSLETLTFFDPSSSSSSFPKVVFGCGHESGGRFSSSASGIIGLGRGPLSIVNQLSESIGGKFSYCLTLNETNATSKISFGANAIVAGPGVVSTPLLNKQNDTFYYLTLEGFSVGSKRVARNVAGSKAAASVEEGNIFIDSGTTYTYVPSDLYEGLESAMVGAIEGKRVSYSQGDFKLCYEEADDDFRGPPLTAHFTGADVELTRENTFVEVEDGVHCLALFPNDSFAILGNLHQRNYEIGYDVAGHKLSFLKKDCSKPDE